MSRVTNAFWLAMYIRLWESQFRHLHIKFIVRTNLAKFLSLRSLLVFIISLKTMVLAYGKLSFPRSFLLSSFRKGHFNKTWNSSPISPLSQSVHSGLYTRLPYLCFTTGNFVFLHLNFISEIAKKVGSFLYTIHTQTYS